MKRLFYFLLFLAPTLSAQSLYDKDHIVEIKITFAENNWEKLLNDYYDLGDDYRLIGTVEIDGTVLDSCGVRFKGNSTYNAKNKKNPFNIKLNYIKKQNYQGYKTLKLASGKNDPSFLREVLSYEIIRNYTEAPQSNYARVFVNGVFYGMFSSSESIDGDFQKNNLYAGKDNVRVKCNPVSAGGQGDGSSLKYYGEDTTKYYKYYEMKSDFGWTELMDLCKKLSNNNEPLDSYLDVDRAIWMLAFNNVVVNLDSYSGPFRQNYYLVKDNNGRFKTVIWDLNMSFGAFSNISTGGGGGGGSLQNLQRLNPYLRDNDSNWPLLKVILANPTYKRMYIAHCKTIFEEQIVSGYYKERAQYYQDLVKDDVQQDVNSSYTYNQFLTNLNSTVSSGGGMGGGGFCGITELMNSRIDFLNSNAAFTAVAPEIAQVNYPKSAGIGQEFIVTAHIAGAESVILAYRNGTSDIFAKYSMKDDGSDGDLVAGDGIYTYRFDAGINKDIQLYIYAENNDAGIFLPARAEHEFLTISASNVAPEVVVNELMASNKTTVQDQDGGYDDWIELYNNTDRDINLEGYLLSDNPSKPAKWTFPNAVIQARGYLIVWADEELDQDGLHADFKLSASGESVVLSSPTGVVLDEVTFPELGEDVAYGRFPNGTGAFKILPATFNAENVETVSSTKKLKENSFTVYPNPCDKYLHIEGVDAVTGVRIYDAGGRMVFSGLPKDNRIYTGDLVPGVYFVRINSGKLLKVIKSGM